MPSIGLFHVSATTLVDALRGGRSRRAPGSDIAESWNRCPGDTGARAPSLVG